MKGLLSSTFTSISKRLPQWLQPSGLLESKVASQNNIINRSVGTQFPSASKLSPTLLNELKTRPASELSLKELEEFATVYYNGVDGQISRDVGKAVEFWIAAGNLGSVDSIYYKALCFRSGEGVSKNTTLAFEDLLRIAENHQHSRAQYTLGVMYLNGEGVEKDEKLSFEYFKKAASGGVLPAYQNLGNAYAEGKGVDKDESEAIKCYEAAAKSGDPAAKFTLATWYYRGRGGLEVDAKKSFQLQLEAAKLGHPMASYNVGSAYLLGDGTLKNEKLAAIWLERAVHFNIPAAKVNLGTMYRHGVGVEKDLNKALELFSSLKDENMRKELVEALKLEMSQQTA